jgi:hypothetical protein
MRGTHVEVKSMDGAAHIKVVIVPSSAGMSFGVDTVVVAGITHALREIFSRVR